MPRPRHESTNVVVHDWQTTDHVCERCAGTFGKLEQTPDPNVQVYRCWCGKVARLEVAKPDLIDDIRTAITALREAPQRQAQVLMSARMVDALLEMPDGDQAKCAADVIVMASSHGLAAPVLVFAYSDDVDASGPVAQINADSTITRL